MEALSVHYGLVAMVVAEVLVIAVLAYLQRGDGREPYLGAWLVSYVGQLTLHLAWHPPMAGYSSVALFFVGGAGGLIGAMALLYGTFQHLGRPMPRGWKVVGALLLGTTMALGIMGQPHSTVAIPIAVSLGLAFFATGVVIVRSLPRSLGVGMAGIGMIALGIHSVDFPILSKVAGFVSWGQLINSWLLLMVGMGLVLMHTERVERRSVERYRALQQAQRMEAIGRLAGGVAHDFNNLLTVINVNLAMAWRTAAETTRPLLETAQNAADQAASLTKQLLTFSRPQPQQTVEVDLVSVVERVVGVLRRTIEEYVELALEVDPGAEVIVVGDPGQLEQVVLNLALNARDAMPDGGLLTIRVYSERDDAVIEVEDTGEGISPEVLTHIFEPFFTTKEIGKGTGLGLATVYAVVKRLGGTIDVDSIPGEGSGFRIRLPAAQRRAAVDEVTPTPRPARAHGGGARILLVEDQPDLCLVVEQILEAVGFSVVSAADGSEALEKAMGQSFELVVTDVVMPRMSGPELVRRLRERGCTSPVLYMSGYPDRSEKAVQREDDLLAKPFTPEELLDAVQRALRRRRKRSKPALGRPPTERPSSPGDQPLSGGL